MITIFQFSSETAKIVDCLADGAVPLELVSSVKSSQKFPASREKNREFA